jgi:hypothetical protein
MIGEYNFNQKNLLVGSHPNVTNPIITGEKADDIQGAEGAADPFITFETGRYYAFVEVFGENGTYISYYTSENGTEWEYGKKVLGDGTDLFSYPLIKKHDSEWYMTPTVLYDGEKGGEDFPLYRSKSFPERWELIEDSRITEHTAMDASPFSWGDKWYVIAQDRETNGRYGNCRLYYSDDLTSSNWEEHPESPLISGPNSMVRGYPVVHSDYVDLFIGWRHVTQYRIRDLSTQSLELSKENPVVRRGRSGWNDKKMHHMDPRLVEDGHNMIITDGTSWNNDYSVGLYSTAEKEKPRNKFELILNRGYHRMVIENRVAPYILPILERLGLDERIKTIYHSIFGGE